MKGMKMGLITIERLGNDVLKFLSCGYRDTKVKRFWLLAPYAFGSGLSSVSHFHLILRIAHVFLFTDGYRVDDINLLWPISC
ncbi:hypothetical protein Pfo_010020 [Paulownia fortunei]|nr:hypothetical protein Pfo_010020 [Paulownia fortunei]